VDLLFQSLPRNIAQVFLLEEWWAGVIIFAGTIFCSPIASLMSVLGSTFSLCTALALGVDPRTVYSGLQGMTDSQTDSVHTCFFFACNVRVPKE
jgi:urea transporter